MAGPGPLKEPVSCGAPASHWVTIWAASAQGVYPVGAAIAQPDLRSALPNAAAGMVDQAMRMIVRPARLAPRIRLRFSNAFGERALHLRDLHVGLHLGGGALVPGTLVRATAPDGDTLVVPPGQACWTAPIELPWMSDMPVTCLKGLDLAVSCAVEGTSGPMTWHAKAMTTSYLSAPGEPDACRDIDAMRLPHTSTSWYFLDAMDAWLPTSARCLVGYGDSLTDGTATTLNGHDRWTDVLQRLLWIQGCDDLMVVNAGIGGNQIVGPEPEASPTRGGPAAIERLGRDLLSLSGVQTVVWIEGINDFSDNGQRSATTVLNASRRAVDQLHARGLQVIGSTVPSALGSTRPGHGGIGQDEQRRAFNAELRQYSPFDALVDLDALMTDPATGQLSDPFNGDSTFGEPGDGVHPTRAGHACMAQAVLDVLSAQTHFTS